MVENKMDWLYLLSLSVWLILNWNALASIGTQIQLLKTMIVWRRDELVVQKENWLLCQRLWIAMQKLSLICTLCLVFIVDCSDQNTAHKQKTTDGFAVDCRCSSASIGYACMRNASNIMQQLFTEQMKMQKNEWREMGTTTAQLRAWNTLFV